MKLRSVLVGACVCLVWLFTVGGCKSQTTDPSNELAPDALGAAALRTHTCWVRMHREGKTPSSDDIPRSCWAGPIEALHPLKVYVHRANVVVVQKESGNVEEGKYINTVISSYLPQSGDDGFVFTNQEGSAYDFRRIKPQR